MVDEPFDSMGYPLEIKTLLLLLLLLLVEFGRMVRLVASEVC